MKTITFTKVTLALSIFALAVPGLADDENKATMRMITTEDFAWDAGLINLKEIRLGGAVQSKSKNKAVRNFGKQMVRDYSRMQQDLEKIAANEGLQLPDANTFDAPVSAPEERSATDVVVETPEQKFLDAQLDVQRVASLKGPSFDKAYADSTVKCHEKAIQQFKDASRTLPDPVLKKYAKEELKVIRRYYEKAQKLQSKFAGRESSVLVADHVIAADGQGDR